MNDFKIYYDNKKTFSSASGGNPPSRGVQAITQRDHQVNFEIVSGADYYVKEFRDGTIKWRGVDIFGLFDYLMDSGSVLFGKTISGEEYGEIMTRAREDEKKSGWLPFERKV